ncbi:MAG: ParB/RepB/Spo0J family partition protein [candidate division WOR-3 bacterium]|nr:ParB/RepB/Spo0J family partition protein [candidate division WOR-3 bacterium]MCX7757677.1 ParB/RepB/Spo0J family partition protein [candidate division WOR-3 bacterium]MDW7987960.1 ParB/RepB/Spo0J family partition protein [candidate division WOR-3 bacterium]
MSKKVLGKGLEALISGEVSKLTSEPDIIQYLSVDEIKPNPYQPRKNPDEDISDLVLSIKEKGVIQPIVVRTRKNVNEADKISYELVVGERRLRAAKLAGLKEIPAVIKELTDLEMLEWALIENLQRTDLNPIDEALAYKQLMEDFSLTHEMIAQKVGKSRSTITNALRLLMLPEFVQNYLINRKITEGHARALLALTDRKLQEEICERIVKEGLSVRETEELCFGKKRHGRSSIKISLKPKDIHITTLEEKLQEYLRTKVRITKTKNRGVVSIEFYSDNDLNRLVSLILGAKFDFK